LEAVFRCILVGFLHARQCPIGAAERFYFAVFDMTILHVDEFRGRNFEVVSVHHINIATADAHAF
jgi:hypothetical protein